MDLFSKGHLSFSSKGVGFMTSQRTYSHLLAFRYKFLSELDDPKAEGPALDLESSLDGASYALTR